MWKTILDLFLPVTCLGCGQEGNFICLTCFEKIPLNQNPPLKLKWGDGLIMASFYENPLLKKAVHQYKYNFIRDLAWPLAGLMSQKLRGYPDLIKRKPLLVPVPLDKKRLAWRGFNQAEFLARAVSQQMNLPLVSDILMRTGHSLPQVEVKEPKLRSQNVKGKFGLSRTLPANLRGESLILVDDVSTTGATLEECVKVLKPLKPKQIWGLVLAKG